LWLTAQFLVILIPMYAVQQVMHALRNQQMQQFTDRELEQEVAALLWVSVLTDKTDDLSDRLFTKVQRSKYNVLDWAGHVQGGVHHIHEPLQVGHDDSERKWALMTPNGTLYQVLMLFQGKGLVMACGDQFKMLNKMQSSCKELFLCAH